jgi:hypothetical protein
MTADAWSKACIVFHSSNIGIAASKPSPGKKEYSSMGLSCLCVVLCTVRMSNGTGGYLSKDSYQTFKHDSQTKDCSIGL